MKKKLELEIMKNEMTGEYTVKILNQTERTNFGIIFEYKGGYISREDRPEITLDTSSKVGKEHFDKAFYLCGRKNEANNNILTTVSPGYIIWLKEAVEAYNAQPEKDEALDKAKYRLKEAMERKMLSLKGLVDRLETVETAAEYMNAKKAIWKDLVQFPSDDAVCLDCIKSTDNNCKECSYGKVHGICSEEGSDYRKMTQCKTKLIETIDNM